MENIGRSADWGGMSITNWPGTQARPNPVSNTERQREFRKRNPGYHRRYYKSAAYWRAALAPSASVEAPPQASASPEARAAAAFDPVI